MGLSQVKAITLLEIVVVIIIIGVLAALGLPRFGTMKERALDKEARANLKLIQAAEKIYRMDISVFWPDSGTVGTASLNTNLKVDLSDRNWSYQASSNSGDSPLDASAERDSPPAPSNWTRTYYIDDEEEEACCCPDDGNPNSVCPSQDLCTNKGYTCPPAW